MAILAPNRRAAETEARGRGLRPREWFHVTSIRSVMGLERGRYVRRDTGEVYPDDVRAAWEYMIAKGWQHLEDTPDAPPG